MKNYIALCLISLITINFNLRADISLPSIFGNHMVLQENSEVIIWGWGRPFREKVSIKTSWDTIEFTSNINSEAEWQIKLRTPKAGGSHSFMISGNNTIVIEDILIGEVWICAGQSNMEWSAKRGFVESEEEMSKANFSELRFFRVLNRSSNNRQLDVVGK